MKRVVSKDGLNELNAALERVMADPTAVFAVADEVKALGFHAAAQKLHREGYAHTLEDGVYVKDHPQEHGVVAWGEGPIKRWVKINPTFFEKDIKAVAKKLRPRKTLAPAK